MNKAEEAKALAAELRAIESRSKGPLLKRAAEAIESIPAWISVEEDIIDAALHRLAAYEDTGLTPEEIAELRKAHNRQYETLAFLLTEADGVETQHLRDLLIAEHEGRLVVLPCKVGTPVYVVGERRIMKCEAYEIRQDNVSGLEYLLSFKCDDDCDGCPFNSWHQDYSGEYSCHGEWGEWCVKSTEFGKTVFLTLEEAEAALQGGASG